MLTSLHHPSQVLALLRAWLSACSVAPAPLTYPGRRKLKLNCTQRARSKRQEELYKSATPQTLPVSSPLWIVGSCIILQSWHTIKAAGAGPAAMCSSKQVRQRTGSIFPHYFQFIFPFHFIINSITEKRKKYCLVKKYAVLMNQQNIK